MASETTSASYSLPSTTSTSTLNGGPPSLPPVGFHVPPTSQSLPGFGELDAGFYASTSSAPYPPAIAPPAFNPGGGGAYQQQPHPPPTQGGVGSFPYPSPGLPLPQTSGSGGTHSPFSGYPPTPFSGGPPSYSPAAPTPHHPSLADPFSTVPLAHPHPSSSAQSISLPPLSTAATSGGNLPPIGRVRCYWVLLSPQLEFVFLDPIMQHHLGEFRDKFLGTNLLDWVHPEEREQLAGDLLPATGEGEEVKGVEAGGVFGSVTRLRYSRMTRVLRHLGCAAPPSPPDAHTYAIDSEWLNLDLTTSWIAGDRKGKGKAGGGGKGGAVLAFLHATEDKDTVSDNDSQNRTEWTNWCGPAVDYPGYLTPSQCEELVAALERVTSSSGGGGGEKAVKVEEGGEEGTVAGPPPHVYQILDAQGRPIVTFPRSNGGGRGEGEKGDKVGESYDVEQFSMLAREVMARPRETIASRTSCTRRYRSKHPVMKGGTLTTIESVVVMYGAITFACFQTGGVYLRPTTTSTSSAASASSSGAPSTAGRKGRLSLITNGAQLHQHHPPTANDFALEDVPPTTPVAGTPHPNGNGAANGKRGSVGGEQNGGNSKAASMSPPTKRFKPSAPAPAPPPPSSQPPQQPLSGLSIMTGGRLFRNTLDVEAITAGGISPTVASASAILGSFSADAHQLAQQHQQQQQQQQTQQPPQRQQQFSPNVTHSPSTGQASYSAFYNAQPPPPQPPTSFSPFDPPTISYSHSHSHPTPPLYGHSAPTYSPHPLSQAHAAPGYFSPAPVSPHDQSMSGPPSYPPIPTSQPFPSTDPTAFSSSSADHTSNNLPPPPPPPPSASASATVVPLDPSQIPVPPPPPPHSQSGKKPPKQRPDGPVFKPNVKACESCGTVNSPEWRKGPTGAKSLCNACGLRYARSVARQKKQAEAAANGGVAPKGKGKKKTGKAAAAAAAAAAEKGVKVEGSPEGSSTPSLPPHSQPSPVHTSLPGGYDLSAYARASPKPYTPYHTTAPNFPGSFAPVMPSPTTSQPSPFHSPLPPTTSSAYFPAMGYSAAPPFSGAPLPIPITTHSPLPPPPPPTYGDYSHSSSFGSSSAGATSHASHLPGISSHHFNASVSPHPHLHSPHLEHPPPPQHSPLESPATASGGMFRSSSQGGALSQAPPQPSYQPYDWRHEQAEGAAGVGQERGEGQ